MSDAPEDSVPPSGGMTRRALMGGALGAVVLVAVGGAGRAFAGQGQLLRPPGAQDENLLLGRCIRCDRCRSACPRGAVDVAHVEDGFIHARTPKMNFRKGYCDFCNGEFLCARNCPTQAISFGFEPATAKIGMAVVDASECLLYRSGSNRCSKQCMDACAYGALSIGSDGGLVVDQAACNGCGACENACPSSSYASYTASGRRGINIEAWEGSTR